MSFAPSHKSHDFPVTILHLRYLGLGVGCGAGLQGRIQDLKLGVPQMDWNGLCVLIYEFIMILS